MTLRWLKFSAVGLLGVGVQLLALTILIKFGLHYLMATAMAVETALLHNYAWHRRWTWAERSRSSLWRFHLANGLISVGSNLAWMRLLTGIWGLPPVPANLVAIAATSLLNFALAERWVFLAERSRRSL